MVWGRPKYIALAALLLLTASICASAQGVDVTADFVLAHSGSQSHRSETPPEVVLWLTPTQPLPPHSPEPPHPGPFRLVQKDKQFIPHLLVVPTGTNVEFPNKDPFFHNVFSLFNGKRFDLGLYESGATRSVRFDREGVSYIFCNIHPEMGAVVLALSTPYYAVSNNHGVVEIHDVPPGSYSVNIWSEKYQPADDAFRHSVIQVGSAPVTLGRIELKQAADPLVQHKNKFGEDYLPSHETHY